MVSNQAEYLLAVKKGRFELDEARDIANTTYADIHEKCDKFVETHKNEKVNSAVDELFDDVAYQIMKISVKEDFDNE